MRGLGSSYKILFFCVAVPFGNGSRFEREKKKKYPNRIMQWNSTALNATFVFEDWRSVRLVTFDTQTH